MLDKELKDAIIAYINWDNFDKNKYKFKEISEAVCDERRWTITKKFVIKEKNSNKYFEYKYEYDACESCEGSGNGLDKNSIHEVEPYEVIEIKYRRKNT